MVVSKKINLKLIIIIISFFVIFLLIIKCFSAIYFQYKLPYEKIVFSNTKYQIERQKVIKLLQKEYFSGAFSTQNATNYQRKRLTVYPDDLYISRIDLNNDKILDVIAFTKAGGFNGTLGGCTIFWVIDKNGQWHKVLNLITHELIIVFKQSHSGFRDIAFMYFDNIGETKAGRSVWVWDGKKYDCIGLRPLKKQDWEVFRDE